jgi:hypothetical protein
MSWTEDDSAHFIDEGKYFVPEREAQIATICAAIPPLAGAGHIVELCMRRDPAAGWRRPHRRTVQRRRPPDPGAVGALRRGDAARRRLLARGPSPGRCGQAGPLQGRLPPARARRRLRAGRRGGTSARGGEVIAAEAWDQAVKARALQLDGDLKAFERFEAENWNLYSDPEPDPIDQPSPLLDMLK